MRIVSIVALTLSLIIIGCDRFAARTTLETAVQPPAGGPGKPYPQQMELPEEDGSPDPVDASHAGEFGQGDFFPKISEPYRCKATVKKAELEGESRTVLNISFAEPCDTTVYRNMLFICENGECDFAGRVRLKWLDNTQFQLILSESESHRGGVPIAGTYTNRFGGFANVCNRGAVGRNIVDRLKAFSCDRVYPREMAKIQFLVLLFNNPSDCQTGITSDAFTGLLSLKSVRIAALSIVQLCELSIGAGAFRSLNSPEGELEIEADDFPVEALKDIHTLKRLRVVFADSLHIKTGTFETMAGVQELVILAGGVVRRPSGPDRQADVSLSFDAEAFRGLSSLQVLELSGHWPTTLVFENVDPRAFEGLNSLRFFRIRVANLSKSPAGVFRALSSLQSVILDQLRTPELPAKIFEGLGHLEKLLVQSDILTQLSADNFASLTHLKELRLLTKRITTVDLHAFRGMTDLQLLSLQGALTEVPSNALSALKNLTTLDLFSNKIGVISARAFAGNSRLQDLRLSANQGLKIFPDAFAGATALTKLDLAVTGITSLSRSEVGLSPSVVVIGPTTHP